MEPNQLDNVIAKTIEEVERGKEDLFRFGAFMSEESDSCHRQLIDIRIRIQRIVEEVNVLEKEFQQSKRELAVIKENLGGFNRETIWDAYETMHRKTMELMRKQESEKILRMQRDHLEKNMAIFEKARESADGLMAAISMALKLLYTDLGDYSTQIGEAKQIQHLGLSVIRAQEEERRRVAREIHDGPAQSLANIVMRAEYCLKLMEVNPQQVAEELRELMWLVRNSLEDVRKIIFDLRPMSLDDLGLLPALKRYTEQFVEENEMFIEVNVNGHERRLENSLEIALFRIIQESLTNVRKHSGAPEAIINIDFQDEQVKLMVRDTGRGFDLAEMDQERRWGNFGLTGMKERVQLLNGTFDIKTASGKGTQILVAVPIVPEC
ncbi:MAG: histidine kinase [Bacillota bacterium]|nr:histidine kinase [Bacillota bacterium]MDW7677021.1 histidine kinase [Bacillota bacterium]